MVFFFFSFFSSLSAAEDLGDEDERGILLKKMEEQFRVIEEQKQFKTQPFRNVKFVATESDFPSSLISSKDQAKKEEFYNRLANPNVNLAEFSSSGIPRSGVQSFLLKFPAKNVPVARAVWALKAAYLGKQKKNSENAAMLDENRTKDIVTGICHEDTKLKDVSYWQRLIAYMATEKLIGLDKLFEALLAEMDKLTRDKEKRVFILSLMSSFKSEIYELRPKLILDYQDKIRNPSKVKSEEEGAFVTTGGNSEESKGDYSPCDCAVFNNSGLIHRHQTENLVLIQRYRMTLDDVKETVAWVLDGCIDDDRFLKTLSKMESIEKNLFDCSMEHSWIVAFSVLEYCLETLNKFPYALSRFCELLRVMHAKKRKDENTVFPLIEAVGRFCLNHLKDSACSKIVSYLIRLQVISYAELLRFFNVCLVGNEASADVKFFVSQIYCPNSDSNERSWFLNEERKQGKERKQGNDEQLLRKYFELEFNVKHLESEMSRFSEYEKGVMFHSFVQTKLDGKGEIRVDIRQDMSLMEVCGVYEFVHRLIDVSLILNFAEIIFEELLRVLSQNESDCFLRKSLLCSVILRLDSVLNVHRFQELLCRMTGLLREVSNRILVEQTKKYESLAFLNDYLTKKGQNVVPPKTVFEKQHNQSVSSSPLSIDEKENVVVFVKSVCAVGLSLKSMMEKERKDSLIHCIICVASFYDEHFIGSILYQLESEHIYDPWNILMGTDEQQQSWKYFENKERFEYSQSLKHCKVSRGFSSANPPSNYEHLSMIDIYRLNDKKHIKKFLDFMLTNEEKDIDETLLEIVLSCKEILNDYFVPILKSLTSLLEKDAAVSLLYARWYLLRSFKENVASEEYRPAVLSRMFHHSNLKCMENERCCKVLIEIMETTMSHARADVSWSEKEKADERCLKKMERLLSMEIAVPLKMKLGRNEESVTKDKVLWDLLDEKNVTKRLSDHGRWCLFECYKGGEFKEPFSKQRSVIATWKPVEEEFNGMFVLPRLLVKEDETEKIMMKEAESETKKRKT